MSPLEMRKLLRLLGWLWKSYLKKPQIGKALRTIVSISTFQTNRWPSLTIVYSSQHRCKNWGTLPVSPRWEVEVTRGDPIHVTATRGHPLQPGIEEGLRSDNQDTSSSHMQSSWWPAHNLGALYPHSCFMLLYSTVQCQCTVIFLSFKVSQKHFPL